MFFTKLFFKIKRFLFKRITGLNPEDVRRLVYCQKYLDKFYRKNITYKDYLSLSAGVQNAQKRK